jgi:4-amino-4-deoxy-L-arabinose transferase-like glycosyltransferase
VPVHDEIFQNSEFLICAFALLSIAGAEGRNRNWLAALIFAVIAAAFLTNIAFVYISRVTIIVIPALALALGWREFRWRGIIGAIVLVTMFATAAFWNSPALRARIDEFVGEVRDYRTLNAATSIGEHAAFLNEAVTIIASAPLFGHGTGSIAEQFRRITAGQIGASGVASDNPHNQSFAVGIQIGSIGMLVLWAMWIAHLRLFRGPGLLPWCGLLIVIENMASSAVHSHLFDFAHGWLYVFGVGACGGMVLRASDLIAGSVALPTSS